ncbi:MAG: S41 family peptidase [Bacteroidales bacterium]|nr:S41 family peptidase [Bacteroidales bacterium]
MKKVLFTLLAVTIIIGPLEAQNKKHSLFKKKEKVVDTLPGSKRLLEVLNLIQDTYVVTPNTDQLSETAIRAMFRSLDPHSIYIPAKDVKRSNEALQGNFEGVGISFSVVNDTIRIAEVIAGGPSEKVGLLPGDKFLRIDGIAATGDSANNAFAFRHLRGKKGTMVVVDMLRGADTLTFYIERDKIPIHSVEVYFMEDDTIGYIALQRFARTSIEEFRKAVHQLQRQGMKALILDLRGNSGGYLDIACGLSNEFLSNGKLIVYQQGRTRPRQDFRANRWGSFRKGSLVVLIDEQSASASEIVSGAVQDWDRGTLIGRRTYGKGLVQTLYNLSDGSQIRLTTARYYTPSGRCIQRPYANGSDEYDNDLRNRYKHGELFSADSIHFPDSLRYTTAGGRTVYGGGGVMPDIFIPMDTTPSTKFYQQCRRKGIINQFPQVWADRHRTDPLVGDFDTYLQHFDSLGVYQDFIDFAASKGVAKDSVQENCSDSVRIFNDTFLMLQIKGLVADRLFGHGHYYRVMKVRDEFYKVAVATLRHEEKEER